MKKGKRAVMLLVCGLLLAALLCGCGDTDGGASSSGTASAPEESTSESANEPDVTARIVFSEDGAAVDGRGAFFADGVLTLSEGGVYAVSGATENGRILVDAPDAAVTLLLEGASLSNPDGCALYVYEAEQVTLRLADGTENVLEDAAAYTFSGKYESAGEEEPDACIYAKENLLITGDGTLLVRGGYKNGVNCRDALVIDGAEVSVEAKKHGVTGKDSLTVQDAVLTVQAGGDALRSTHDEDAARGWVTVTSSRLALTSGEDGIQAETALTLRDVSCVLVSGGGAGGTLEDEQSAKGFKAGTTLLLDGGSYDLDCLDDALHADGDVQIMDGELLIQTGDDGVHADGNVAISGGVMTILRSYEGVEGLTVEISGGLLAITAEDDGINAAGEETDALPSGGSSACITISGGTIRVDAEGDGLDSNGDLLMTGGELYVSGPSRDGNAALDFDGVGRITGGTVVAAGPSGMAQRFGEGSTQGCILVRLGSRQTGAVCLTDADGNVLVEWTSEKEFDCVVISCPELADGGTYTLRAGDEEQVVLLDGLLYGEDFGMGGRHGGMRRP